MKVIASAMPADEIAGLREIFKSIDADSSGTITADELRAALQEKGSLLKQVRAGGGRGHSARGEEGEACRPCVMCACLKRTTPCCKQTPACLPCTVQEELEGLLTLIDQDANGTIDYEVGQSCTCVRVPPTSAPVALTGRVVLHTCTAPASLRTHHPTPPPAKPCTTPLAPRPLPHQQQEFIAATLSQHQLEKQENMRAAFAHFDTDGSGTISRDELREALRVSLHVVFGTRCGLVQGYRLGSCWLRAGVHVWHARLWSRVHCIAVLAARWGLGRPRSAQLPAYSLVAPVQASFAGSVDSEVEIEKIIAESDKNGG